MTRSRDVADTQDNLGGAVAPFVAGKNILANGAGDFWQRGTTFTNLATGSYFADRWKTELGGTGVDTNSVTRDTSVPNVNAQYSMKMALTATPSSFLAFAARQVIETQQATPLFGKTCVVSFWYRSNKTGNHGIRIIGSVQTGGIDQVTTFSVTTANTWEFKTVVVTAFAGITTIATGATDAGAYLDLGLRVGGTGAGQASAASGDYFQYTLVQLEIGSVATPFSRANGTIQGELALCQRYYQKFLGAGSGQVISGFGACITTTIGQASIVLPVQMRVSPTVFDSYLPSWYNYANNTTYNSGTFTLTDATPSIAKIRYTHGSGIFTAGQGGEFVTSGGNGYLAVSAEL